MAKPDFVVSPGGDDHWSGRLARPNRARSDGPFATLPRAQQAVRELKASQPKRAKPIVVLLRGGTYFLDETLVFKPEDSGTAKAPVIYAASPKEQPLISGGVRLVGWDKATPDRWTLKIPEVASGRWNFTQLFVNGQRRFRPRLPKEGYFFIAGGLSPSPQWRSKGYDRFRYFPEDLSLKFSHPEEIEVLCFHIWSMSRMRLKSIDQLRRLLTLTGPTRYLAYWMSLSRGRRYILENVREALKEPGQWHLDRPTGTLTYLPLPGEKPGSAEVIAPRLARLVELKGDVADRRWVQYLTFKGIRFAHTNWTTPPEGYSFQQAEAALDGAIAAEGARHCAIEDCAVTHVANYAIEWGAGCKHNRVEHCTLADLGAGGVKIGTMSIPEDPEALASHHTIRHSTIAHAGRMHPAGIGIWIGHSPHNVIERNDIFDLYYTSISVGWSWGYGRSEAHHNLILGNHLHTIGQGVLSDMGGIYTLGVSPGLILRNNVIHDVQSYDYGGWGIYFDEGTTGALAEHNLTYRIKECGFHQHYGKENTVRNNIFALGQEMQLARSRAEDHLSFRLTNNIVYADGAPLLGRNWSGSGFALDSNLYWDAAGEPSGPMANVTWEQWKARGQDAKSQIADPLFKNPSRGDFRLKRGSPASKIGFKPIDFSLSGRKGKAASLPPVPAAYPPGRHIPLGIFEDFEETAMGEKSLDASTHEDNDRATARATDEAAASGRRSLKFVKTKDYKHDFNPHMYYETEFTSGVLVGRFALRLTPGSRFLHEWRDVFPGQDPGYRAGPALYVERDMLSANGNQLIPLPARKWVLIEIICSIGDKATGTYDLTVTLPNGKTHRYPGLTYEGKLARLRWFGFVAPGTRPGTAFYLDDISLATR